MASPIFLQSISQNLADTVVVNETQSFTKVRGVDPVTSSHCALVVPPEEEIFFNNMPVTFFNIIQVILCHETLKIKMGFYKIDYTCIEMMQSFMEGFDFLNYVHA